MIALAELIEQTGRRPRLLIVDDQPIHIRALCAIFKEEYDISIATGGTQAMALFAEVAPDLVLLDVVMPDIDGFEVCRRMQSVPFMRAIPIVFLTAKHAEDDQVAGFEAGAADFILKPYNATIVRARVERLLSLKLQSDLLEKLVMTDALTRVANRRRFDEYFEQSWSYCARSAKSFSLLMIDVDHFKLYNDHYGHPQGDVCLRAVASALMEVVTRSHDLTARYGGEEFACLLPGTDMPGAEHLAQQVIEQVRRLSLPHATSPSSHCVTVSIGVASALPSAEHHYEILIKAADDMLYRAKAMGRNRFLSVRTIGTLSSETQAVLFPNPS